MSLDFSANDNSDGALNKFDTDVTVHSSGRNTWLAPAIFKSTCKINVAFFPFDEQVLAKITTLATIWQARLPYG